MRIVFFTLSYPTPWQPAASEFNRGMVESLRAAHEVEVVAPVPWTQRWRAALGAPTGEHPLYLFPPRVLRERYGDFLWLSAHRTLRLVTSRFRPHVFLGYWAHPDGEVALRAAREAGCPGVVIVGGSDLMLLAQHEARLAAIRRVLQSADAILTVGRTLQERAVALGAAAERVTPFYRGVDGRFFPADSSEARRKLRLPLEAPIALWVGRMVPVKGLPFLLDAWSSLQARIHAARLVLVGDGPERAALHAQVARLGLSDRLAFVGARPHAELPLWYRAADVTVLPSLSEGIPNVLLESLACGTPFVASDVGGVREIEGGPLCKHVPPGQPGPLAEALEQRLSDPRRVSGLPPGQTLAASAATVTRVLERVVSARPTPP